MRINLIYDVLGQLTQDGNPGFLNQGDLIGGTLPDGSSSSTSWFYNQATFEFYDSCVETIDPNTGLVSYSLNTPITSTNTPSLSGTISLTYNDSLNSPFPTSIPNGTISINGANKTNYMRWNGVVQSLNLSLFNNSGFNFINLLLDRSDSAVGDTPGGGSGGGATSLTVSSPDGSVTQVAPSTYNDTTKNIDISLKAVGGSGMTNPMTAVGDMIVGGTVVSGKATPTKLAKGSSDQSLVVNSSGSVAWDTTSYTKYNYPISCKNTPTFAAGEEYLLTVGNPDGELTYSLVFRGGSQSGATVYGSIAIDFSLLHSSSTGYPTVDITITDISQSISVGMLTQTQLNALFLFNAYILSSSVVINGVTIPANSVIYTIKLNSALPFTGSLNTITGTVMTTNINMYSSAVNPNNNALLGINNDVITASEFETEEGGVNDVRVLTPRLVPQTLLASMVENAIPAYTNGLLSDSGIKPATVVKKYVKYFYIDPDSGFDANNSLNNGSQNTPFKTVAYAQTIMPQGSIGVLLGKTKEAAVTLTKPNIDWLTFGTRSALAGFTNKVTVNNTVSGSSIRFTGLSFDGGIEPATTNVGGIYLYGGQTTAAFAKNDAGYMEMVGFDCSNNTVTVNKGQLVVNGGKTLAPTITGTGTQVTFDNVGLVLGNASVAANSVFLAFETNWVAGATGAAIAGAVGSTVVLDGINFARANGTRANLTLNGSYDFQHCDFESTGSTFGTLIGVPDNFTRMRLWQAPVITTATQMYVKDPVTGEMSLQNIGTTPAIAGSSLYMNNWGADQPVTNGFISLTGANAVAVGSDISYSGVGADISVASGNNYDFNVSINSRQSGVPSASLNTLGYSGNTFTTDNIATTNGSISNNIYTCTTSSGSVKFLQSYDSQGAMNLFTPRATLAPNQMAISPNSSSTSLYTYTQISTTGSQPTLVRSGAISSQPLVRSASVGGSAGNNESAFTHPFLGSTPGEYAACGGFNVSVVSDSLNATRFAYSVDNGATYTNQTTPLSNTVVLESSLTACYAKDINKAIFIGTSGVSCLIDLTLGTFTQVNISQQGIKQVTRGPLGGTLNFVAVGNNNTWNQFVKSTDGSSWLTIAANNLPSILPTTGTVTPVYSMGGVCLTKDSARAWIVAVNDTANNITYLCSSTDLINFSSLASTASAILENANTPEMLELKNMLPEKLNDTIQSYSGFNVAGLFCELVSGVGLSPGACSVMMYSSNTSGNNNKVVYNNVFWAIPSSWITLTNPANISGGQKGFMYPSGVFGLWISGGSFVFNYSADGGATWTNQPISTKITYMMPLGDYQLCSCCDVSASRKFTSSYRNNYTTTILYDAAWIGGQQLLAGTNSTPIVNLTNQVVATYTYSDTGTMLLTGAPIIPPPTHGFFNVGVSGINVSEKISLLNGTAYVIQNTFLYTLVGTNCTVTTTIQAQGTQGNIQTSIQGLITNVQDNATVRLRCDYNNGTNTLGGANSIKITKL